MADTNQTQGQTAHCGRLRRGARTCTLVLLQQRGWLCMPTAGNLRLIFQLLGAGVPPGRRWQPRHHNDADEVRADFPLCPLPPICAPCCLLCCLPPVCCAPAAWLSCRLPSAAFVTCLPPSPATPAHIPEPAATQHCFVPRQASHPHRRCHRRNATAAVRWLHWLAITAYLYSSAGRPSGLAPDCLPCSTLCALNRLLQE